MARRPLTAALGRTIGTVLTEQGFESDGLVWWLRSELGDFAVVDVQASRSLPGTENCFVNVASVPGPLFDWLRWLDPDDYGDVPDASSGVLHERVQPPGVGWLSLTSPAAQADVGAWVAAELTDQVLPRLLRRFDRAVLLAELDRQPASGHSVMLRAAFRAEAGDMAGADEAFGPADEDDENMARYRTWLHEYAASRAGPRS
jgi:hypothetical protein